MEGLSGCILIYVAWPFGLARRKKLYFFHFSFLFIFGYNGSFDWELGHVNIRVWICYIWMFKYDDRHGNGLRLGGVGIWRLVMWEVGIQSQECRQLVVWRWTPPFCPTMRTIVGITTNII